MTNHEPVTLSIVDGEQPNAVGTEFGLAGIEVDDATHAWLADNGVDSPAYPDRWVLVTPASERTGDLFNLVDQREITPVGPGRPASFYVEVQVGTEGGIWQAVHNETVITTDSAEDVAVDTATNQNITDDLDEQLTWRVRVWLAGPNVALDSAAWVAEAGPGADGLSLTELAGRIARLGSLPPVARVAEAKELADATKATLARVRRAAAYEATRVATYEDVATALGVGVAAINQLVTQHRQAI